MRSYARRYTQERRTTLVSMCKFEKEYARSGACGHVYSLAEGIFQRRHSLIYKLKSHSFSCQFVSTAFTAFLALAWWRRTARLYHFLETELAKARWAVSVDVPGSSVP